MRNPATGGTDAPTTQRRARKALEKSEELGVVDGDEHHLRQLVELGVHVP